MTLPRSGMIVSGNAYQRQPLAPVTAGTGGGLLPTPDTGESLTGHGRRGGKIANGRQSGASLDALARHGMLPTPSASDYRSGTGYSHDGKKQSPQLRHLSGGPLNPRFVEQMMGFPIDNTALEPSETALSRRSLNSSEGQS